MKNPIEQALKHSAPCHQRPKGRVNPTPRQERRLRKKVRRLASLVAKGKLSVEVTA